MQGTCIPVPGWRTKVPYASGQLNPHDATRDPTQSGECVPQLERSAAVKIQHSTTKTQDSKKKKKKKKVLRRTEYRKQKGKGAGSILSL